MSEESCYVYISEADSLAGPRIIQALDCHGRKSHRFYSPYQYPTADLPLEKLRLAAASLGYTKFKLVRNGQLYYYKLLKDPPIADDDDPIGQACKALANQRISLWIGGYPNALKALSHVGNVYPRWGYNVINYLLKNGPDWNLFRLEPLAYFLAYLEWCLIDRPSRFKKYEHYLVRPPDWYTLNYGEPKRLKSAQLNKAWNRYNPVVEDLTRVDLSDLTPLDSRSELIRWYHHTSYQR